MEALSHNQWLIRAYASAGLGRNDEKSFVKLAGALLQKERNPGARIGILWGLTLAREKTARSRLSQAISTLRGGPDIRVELVALDAVRNLSLVETLPFVRQMLTHANFFVIRDAAKTIQSLLDRRSIPLLIPLLSHERKLVRDEALAALKRLTSQRNKRTRAAFERWCTKNCDPTWPRSPDKEAEAR